MPFRHVVMFRFADGLGPDHVAAVGAGLDALPGQIEQIRGYVHGPDLGLTDGSYDYAIVADFDDADGWRAYRDHPVHLAFIDALITGKVAARAAVQYET